MNFSRIKVLFLGAIGLLIGFYAFNIISPHFSTFTPYEIISLDITMLSELLISLFMIFWGIEPLTPNISRGEKKG
jgi:hypothetical protein